MEHRTVWSCLVEKESIGAFDDKAGVEFFKNYPFLIDLAKIMLDSDYYYLSFYYQKEMILFVELYFNEPYGVIELTATKTDIAFHLTPRELDIITLLSSGLTDQQIANHLFISHRTVNKHIQHIFEKVGVDHRVHLSQIANEYGLYRLPMNKSIQSTLPILILANRLYHINSAPIYKKPSIHHKSPLKIGLPYVAEGQGGLDAISMVNGATLAVQMINAKGGIHGRQVELIAEPFIAFDKNSILTAYQTLLAQDIDAISAGYACYLPEVHELIATQGLPYLHTATNDEAMRYASLQKMGNIFQLCASDINYGLGLVRFIKAYPKLWKHKKLLILKPCWQSINIGLEYLSCELKKLKWQIDIMMIKHKDWQSTVQQLQKSEMDLLVFASFFTEDMCDFYQAFIKNPLPIFIYGIYAPSALNQTDGQMMCEGVIWATTNGFSDELIHNKHALDFCQIYQSVYQTTPNQSQASLAYDGIQILANVWHYEPYAKRFNKINQTLKMMVNHGVNGSYYLGNEMQVGLSYPDDTKDLSISQAHLVFQIQQGKQKLINPSPFAKSDLQIPKWIYTQRTLKLLQN